MKIKRVTALLMIFVLTAFLTGCAGIRSNNDADNGKLKVITTIFAGYDFVRQIAGDNVDLSMLLKPGAEAHSYEPTPRDIIEIQNCDIFIYVGGENDAWIDNILDSIDSGKMRTIKLLDCVDDRYEEETVEGMDAHEEHEHEHGDEHGDEHDEWEDSSMKRTLAESKKQRTKNSRHRQVWKDALMNEQKNHPEAFEIMAKFYNII